MSYTLRFTSNAYQADSAIRKMLGVLDREKQAKRALDKKKRLKWALGRFIWH
jgi:hypothetical protein